MNDCCALTQPYYHESYQAILTYWLQVARPLAERREVPQIFYG
jgi:hypothetical protein